MKKRKCNEETKRLWRVPTEEFRFMYPRKHKVLQIFQRRCNFWFGDKRRINSVTIHTNPLNQTFLFGRYGHRSNETVVTIWRLWSGGYLFMEK